MAAHIAETAIRAFLSEIAGVFNRPEAPRPGITARTRKARSRGTQMLASASYCQLETAE